VRFLFERTRRVGGAIPAQLAGSRRRRDRPGHRSRLFASTDVIADVIARALRGRGAGSRRSPRGPVSRAQLVARASEARDVLPEAHERPGSRGGGRTRCIETVAMPLSVRGARGGAKEPTTSRSRPPRPSTSLSTRSAPTHSTRARLVSIGRDHEAAALARPESSEPHVESELAHDIDCVSYSKALLVDVAGTADRRTGMGSRPGWPAAAVITFLSD